MNRPMMLHDAKEKSVNIYSGLESAATNAQAAARYAHSTESVLNFLLMAREKGHKAMKELDVTIKQLKKELNR